MIVCPVCEHPQDQGTTCDVCGRELVVSAPVAVPLATLPELEQTRADPSAVRVPVELMVELDAHRSGDVAIVADPVAELERTALPDSGAVPAAELPEMERTHFADDGQRTALPTLRTCRYCRNVQASGLVCDKCGLRLPGYVQTAEAEAPPAFTNCPACGVKGLAGKRCMACGAYIRTPEP